MSSNHLIYDTCAYQKDLSQSVNPLSYQLNPAKYNSCKQCRMQLGLVGGNNVSIIRGNLVDLESDLQGITRANSNCPQLKYQGSNDSQIQVVAKGKSNQPRTIDTSLQHLPACQIISYKAVPLPQAMKLDSCRAGY